MESTLYAEMVTLDERHWWVVARRQIVNALLCRLALPRNAGVLEIGCGSGGHLAMLSPYASGDATEYEAKVRQLAQARGIAGRIASCEMPHDFPFAGETFDLIVMLDVLEHIEDDIATLEMVRQHLDKNGWF